MPPPLPSPPPPPPRKESFGGVAAAAAAVALLLRVRASSGKGFDNPNDRPSVVPAAVDGGADG
eukprot:CAMPEP_0113537168 /NCGR_PEP_ID=MMETSP0015_2-20120614/6680_1 /TAXON_ID=2838 /ORGANISM="Odontella" /LENGTH=62 /DNA_ID=CAMNT_0000436641 /DNA_START=136 /DNA_END=320 /DNA_ORIENTATION=+ /assembly_acc=CAM_ASM_000160